MEEERGSKERFLLFFRGGPAAKEKHRISFFITAASEFRLQDLFVGAVAKKAGAYCAAAPFSFLAPICFVSYLSFDPPMVGFSAGKQSHTGRRVRETGKVILTVPGESLAGAVMACGSSTGASLHKAAEYRVEMKAVEGSDILIPADTKLAMVAALEQTVETGDHILHICRVEKFLGDVGKKGLFAWNGFGKAAPAAEG